MMQMMNEIAMLKTMFIFTSTRRSAKNKIEIAGSARNHLSLKNCPKTSVTLEISFSAPVKKPKRRYSSRADTVASHPVRIIPRMLSYKFVFVISAIKSAEVETGEHLSPKYAPERIAPPQIAGDTPMALPTLMQMTPMVAAVPIDVPVRTETSAQRENVAGRNSSGVRASEAKVTIYAMVPDARQSAVRTPTRSMTTAMFVTDDTPEPAILSNFTMLNPRRKPCNINNMKPMERIINIAKQIYLFFMMNLLVMFFLH